MATLAVPHAAIVEAEHRLTAASRILEQVSSGNWHLTPATIDSIETLCAKAVSHLRGEA